MGNSFASGLKKLFFGAIVVLSATTSFLFFVEIFSLGRGMVQDAAFATLLNGAVGVLVTDGAAMCWMQIYLRASDNNDLRNISATGAAIGIVASAICSFGYLLMVGAQSYTVDPAWRGYVIWAMAFVIVAHFILVFLSGYKATSAKIDEKTADMLAEGADEMLKLTEEQFRAQIPSLARHNADELTRRLAGRFAHLTALSGLPQDEEQPTGPPEAPPPPGYMWMSEDGRRWQLVQTPVDNAVRNGHGAGAGGGERGNRVPFE